MGLLVLYEWGIGSMGLGLLETKGLMAIIETKWDLLDTSVSVGA